MARIPQDELERLKREIDLVALVRSKGVELKKHGSKDLAGRCPFHEDAEASFIVTPGKNLFHCMGCGKAGSGIDFVMLHEGVSFRHAYEILANGAGKHLLHASEPVKRTCVPKLPPPVAFDTDDKALMEQVVDYYHERLKQTPAALEYLHKRGITDEAIAEFRIGFADRTLGLRLPIKATKTGGQIRQQLTKLGILRESTGHEHFNGCVVFPIRNEAGEVTEIYGRKIHNNLRTGTAYHLYLPGPHVGIFNRECLTSREIILCESVIDALTFWCAGMRNVTCIYGTEGFSDELLQAFIAHKVQRVYLAYDRDPAGDRAAERDCQKLADRGLECHRVQFPHGMDANEYALTESPSSRSLQLKRVINSAEWLGGHTFDKAQTTPSTSAQSDNYLSLAADIKLAANVEEPEKPDESKDDSEPVDLQQPIAAKEKAPLPDAPKLRQSGDDLLFEIADRIYRVRGFERKTSDCAMKINLRLSREELYYVNVLDLYQSKLRAQFIDEASRETLIERELIKRDLGKLLLKLEELQAGQESETPAAVNLSETDHAAAMELLKDPHLLDRILTDLEACGIVGERTNKLAGYIAAVSRKLDRPLAIIIQSTSAAGKTSLMESVLEMMPEEERIKYSAMTGQSLYYLGEKNLKHKILAIVEEEGAEKASYALKLLQSEGELTIASTGKDELGRMKTEEYHVEGPVMIFLTTTAVDIDEELLNRCIVLTVDESREQTEAIHRSQREAETLEGLMRKVTRTQILTVHRNAQRLLRNLHVVNPYAPKLRFLSDRTRTRRDHVKYLTFIRTIALLHQYQRPLKQHNGLDYIEVEPGDIVAANGLAHEVLGRSLDELPPQTRKLLVFIDEMVRITCRERGIERKQCLFSRREIREKTGWSNTQLKVHLDRLVDLEYLVPYSGRRGQNYHYELVFDGDLDHGKPQLPGLSTIEDLMHEDLFAHYDVKFTGVIDGFAGRNGKFAGPKRPQNGAFTGSLRGNEIAVNGHKYRGSGAIDSKAGENSQEGVSENGAS